MNVSAFQNLGPTIRRRHRWIVLGWVLVVLISLGMISGFLSSVNYNITSPGGSSNSGSQTAQNILNAQFPASANNSGSNSVLIILQGVQPYSTPVKSALFALNVTLSSESKTSNYTGMSSIYTVESAGLDSLLPSLLQDVARESVNISSSQPSLSSSQAWSKASTYVATATAGEYSEDPFFSVNSTSLGILLSSLQENSTQLQVDEAAISVVSNQSFAGYPLVLTRALESNYVGSDNTTELVTLNFASSPTTQTLEQIQDAINSSSLATLGTVYTTGTAPITQGVESDLTSSLHVTIGIALLASLLIVGILFLAPLAALLPLIMAGLSIITAFSVIYVVLVRLGHQTLSFLTPSLTALLMLGLAIDYSVLQMRRTREERLKGKSPAESIDVSVRWAGQAVVTAGITVVTAYIIMAAANVPLISGVGASIAIGVSVLLLMSLTLLPSLECMLGDKLFWPRAMRSVKPGVGRDSSGLRKLAEGTLKRKVAVACVISLVALGAFAAYNETPTGENLLGLLPNNNSLQGLTVYTDSFGINSINLVITTSTPIVQGADQFNQTLLNEIQLISSTAGNSTGVVKVVSPTMPFGSAFDYESLSSIPAPVRAQYQAQMLSLIGQNNETVIVGLTISSSEMSASAISSLQTVERNIGGLSLPGGMEVYYAGTTPQVYDSQSSLGATLPEVVAILAVAIYTILFVQLRSIFTPLRLIFTILCSVAISLATLCVLFYDFLKLPIIELAPLFVIVTMLGVGIDYDIFFVTRIREEVINGRSDDEAIKEAVEKMWFTLFGLGLVLFCVFGADVLTGIPLLQEIGITVAAAVLVDVAVVILFFVPSLMGLAQDFNWWPSKIGRRDEKTPEESR